ncbi:MAG: hypothetical protein ABF990_13385 [Acetobacter sp.]
MFKLSSIGLLLATCLLSGCGHDHDHRRDGYYRDGYHGGDRHRDGRW